AVQYGADGHGGDRASDVGARGAAAGRRTIRILGSASGVQQSDGGADGRNGRSKRSGCHDVLGQDCALHDAGYACWDGYAGSAGGASIFSPADRGVAGARVSRGADGGRTGGAGVSSRARGRVDGFVVEREFQRNSGGAGGKDEEAIKPPVSM